MTIFFQHVGEKGGLRDFPKTIGVRSSGLVKFSFDDVESYLDGVSDAEKQTLRQATAEFAPEGFQIWGIPSGAKSILRSLEVGDVLLLLEAVGPGGTFAYGGRVIAFPKRECFQLSQHLWGEQRFPLIVFLRGHLTNYRWYDFCGAVGYKKNWNPAGNTYRLKESMVSAGYGDEEQLLRRILGISLPLEPEGVVTDYSFLEEGESYIGFEEGAELLREHLKRERSATLIKLFKEQLKQFSCSICSFDFELVYGPLGHEFIEAHHVRAVAEMKQGERTRIEDLIAVCSNCHRMLHRQYPALKARDIIAAMTSAFEQKKNH